VTQDRYLGPKLTHRQTAEVLEKLLGCSEPGAQKWPKYPGILHRSVTERLYQGRWWAAWGLSPDPRV
jgi:hypothetical protein